MATDQREAFEAIYLDTVDRVLAYCLRHTDAASAEDAVSDVYLTAWRRRTDLPEPPLPWLIVTARHVLARRQRSSQRRDALTDRLARLGALAASPADVRVAQRDELVRTLADLPEDDREALLLTAWDGLTSAQAAEVLGTTAGALRVRVHRARRRLASISSERNSA